MSWVNDLGAVTGIAPSAATLATVMYAACLAAEKIASRQALGEISSVLKDREFERSSNPAIFVKRIFIWTFGESADSWRCYFTSIIATFTICGVIASVYAGHFGPLPVSCAPRPPNFVGAWPPHPEYDFYGMWFVCFVCAVVPDYLSLWKTRLLLDRLTRRSDFVARSWLIIVLDSCLSVGIYFTFWFLIIAFLSVINTLVGAGQELAPPPSSDHCHKLVNEDQAILWKIALGSTLFTTLWAMLILLSKLVLRLLAPIHMLTSWFFDVDKYPLQAIGIVAGALVMLGSLMLSIARALI